jgi:rieske iron-sulfur protein
MTEPAPETEVHEDRRRFLKWVIGLGTSAFALAFALPALALKTLTTQQEEIAGGEPLVYATGDLSGTNVNATNIPVNGAIQAFPKGKSDDQDNLIELVRIGEGASGVVAFSAICTHLGCTVLPKLTDAGYIPCPCHGSLFDPTQNAKPVGGPANRPLPSLPIAINADGTVAATGTFSGPIGPQ